MISDADISEMLFIESKTPSPLLSFSPLKWPIKSPGVILNTPFLPPSRFS